MDFLDKVQDLESQAVREGYMLGVWDAKNGDMRDAGVQSGIIKGYPIGLELGFMRALQEDASDLAKKEGKDEKEGAQAPGETKAVFNDVVEETTDSMKNRMEFHERPKDAIKSIGARIEKRRELLAQRLAEVPSHNDSGVDFNADLESLRALYRSCNPSAGKFIREGSVAKEETSLKF